MRPLLAALLTVACLWTAGCAGPGEPITMKDGLAEAREEAEGWGDNLQLAGAVAIEPFRRVTEQADNGSIAGEFVTHLDSNPGDGRAPGWLYAFVADDGRCVLVALASGLGVLAEGWEECRGEQRPAALPDGILDSDRVARLLDDHADWPESDDGTTLTWELAADEAGQAYWTVFSGNETEAALAVVDAVEGNVTVLTGDDVWGVGPVDGAPGADGADWGGATFSANAPAITPLTPLEVEVELGDGATLGLSASAQTSLVGLVDLVITGPDGEVYREDVPGSLDVSLAGLPGGDYTVRMEHDNVALNPSIQGFATWSS